MSKGNIEDEADYVYRHRHDPDLAGEEVDLEPGTNPTVQRDLTKARKIVS